jgi:hypothetical protein
MIVSRWKVENGFVPIRKRFFYFTILASSLLNAATIRGYVKNPRDDCFKVLVPGEQITGQWANAVRLARRAIKRTCSAEISGDPGRCADLWGLCALGDGLNRSSSGDPHPFVCRRYRST